MAPYKSDVRIVRSLHKRKVEREESQREEMSKKEMSREILILTDVHPTVKRMKEGGGECNEAGYL